MKYISQILINIDLSFNAYFDNVELPIFFREKCVQINEEKL